MAECADLFSQLWELPYCTVFGPAVLLEEYAMELLEPHLPKHVVQAAAPTEYYSSDSIDTSSIPPQNRRWLEHKCKRLQQMKRVLGVKKDRESERPKKRTKS